MTQSRRRSGRRIAALVAAGGALAARRARWFPVRVAGDSMEPTLPEGAFVAVSPRRDPSFGSVVVVRRGDASEHIKRVVALPGEGFRVGADDIALGPGQYAVAGDNRARSTDSRHYGPVSREEIAGVARVCYWPPRSWRLFTA